jgi:hypothetical protein
MQYHVKVENNIENISQEQEDSFPIFGAGCVK